MPLNKNETCLFRKMYLKGLCGSTSTKCFLVNHFFSGTKACHAIDTKTVSIQDPNGKTVFLYFELVLMVWLPDVLIFQYN